MSNNVNLQIAKSDKFDEFYTLEQSIIDELQHYTDQLKNKVIYCNCDNPTQSNFWKYFVENFDRIGIKKLISTHYDYPTYKMEYDGHDFFKTDLEGNGDFRSQECLQILDESDIVITNPPFSIFREYINILIKHHKQFLILGNMNCITYKDIFPHIKEGRLRLGVNSGSMTFKVPEYFDRNNVYKKDGEKYAKFGNICWYTNLEHYKMHNFIKLDMEYDSKTYPKYDNYDAIEVGKVSNIPKDYIEPMGVPITFLQHYNAEQFEILGNLGSYAVDGYSLSPAVYVNGKKKFKRILIRTR